MRSAWDSVLGVRRGKDGTPELGQPGTLVVALTLTVPPLVALLLATLCRGRGGALGVALLVASASFTAGAFLGFLFSIPRTLTSAVTPTEAGTLDHTPNTNLEQVSDWLTKILVGVGLIELGRLTGTLGDVADRVGPALVDGRDAAGPTLALGLIVAFLIAGFLSAYLFTRLRLQGAFALADRGALGKFVVNLINQQGNARALVRRQLSAGEGDPPPLKELNDAVREALSGDRREIFYLARDHRRQFARKRRPTAREREDVARAIPVIQALIAAEADDPYFRTYGELGYLHLTQNPPNYLAAEEAFAKAIELRDREGHSGFRIFNLLRAECLVHLYGDDATPEQVAEIHAELQAGLADRRLRVLDPAMDAWLRAHPLP